MGLLSDARERLRCLVFRSREEREMDEELRHHLEMEIATHVASGMSREAARRAAVRRLGAVERVKEEVRDARGVRLVDDLRADVRYAVRALMRAPAFTCTAALSLALAIGANTTIFSISHALLLEPLPGRDPGRLVTIYTSDFSGPRFGASSFPDYLDIEARGDVFADVAATRQMLVILGAPDRSTRITAQLVTTNYFDVLGLSAQAGRTFVPADDAPGGGEAEIVLGHALWQQQLGGDASVVGRAVRVNGQPFTVVGIAPEGFTGQLRGRTADAWIPIAMEPRLRPGSTLLTTRSHRGLMVFARLQPGVSIDGAQANLTVLARSLYQADPESWRDRRGDPRVLTVLPEHRSRIFPGMRGMVVGFMTLLAVAVGLVLLIACANVANMLLARGASRRREMAVRLAIGARRERIVRQLLTESALLALFGCVLGSLMAYWALRGVAVLLAASPITGLDVAMDLRVLGFAVMLSLATTVLFGLAPALQASRPEVAADLHAAGAGTPSARRWLLRNGLIVGQVAMSLLLLVGAGLILRSLDNASRLDPGFDPEDVLLFSVDPSLHAIEEPQGRQLFDDLRQRLERVPQVVSVTMASTLPLGGGFSRRGVTIEDYEAREGEDREVHVATVTAGYMATMRTPVVRGRAFTRLDAPDAPPVILVNEAFVRRYWPGQDPLGKHVTMSRGGEPVAREVVGIVRDGKYVTLGEDPRPFMWVPHAQDYAARMIVAVRTTGDPLGLMPTVRQEVRALDADLALFDVTTLAAHASVALMPVQAASSVLGLFGLAALLLAAGGLYGLMAFMLSQRTKEIGVRLAVGGSPAAVLRLAMRRGLVLALIGGAIGMAAAVGTTRFLSFLLYGLGALDPPTLAGVTACMALVAIVACYVPARRAIGRDLVGVLRED